MALKNQNGIPSTSDRYRGHAPLPPGVTALQMPMRMSPAQRIFLEAAADRVHRSISAYAVLAAVEQAERELGCTINEWIKRNPERVQAIWQDVLKAREKIKEARRKAARKK